MEIQLGCFTRPWREHTLPEAARGMKDAGFNYIGLMSIKGGRVIDHETTPEQVAEIKRVIRKAGVKPVMQMATIPLSSVDAGIKGLLRQIDYCHELGIRFAMTGGASRAEEYETYYTVAREGAEYGLSKGVTVLLKPHGGLSNTTHDTIASWKKVNHQNFKICYDAGNLLYYAGEDPLAHIKEIAPIVAGMCIKDEVGGQRGDVMITPGDGDVDFYGVFAALREAGFAGPCVVECTSGTTLEEVNTEAKRAYQFMVRVLQDVGYMVR